MSVPERIFLAEEEADRWLRIFEYNPARERKTDIPYRRETVCEYREHGPVGYFLGPIMYWTSGCEHDIGQDRPHWTYCPYCGGTIRIVGQEETNT